jgi:hypothetical protein
MDNLEKKKEFTKGILTIAIPLIIIIFLSLTLLFPKIFLEYSGVFTFYSLLTAIGLFIFNEVSHNLSERSKENEKGKAILRNIEQERKVIYDQLNSFKISKIEDLPVSEGLIYFSDYYLHELPEEIYSRLTENLKLKIHLANKEIEKLNDIIYDLQEVLWGKAKVPSKKITNEVIKEEQRTWDNLKEILELIGTITRSFGIY